MRYISYFLLVIFSVCPPAFAQTMSAQVSSSQRGAENFVQSEASQVLQVLRDQALPLQEKKKIFRARIDKLVNVPVITRFVLGRYARAVSPEDYKVFSNLFYEYAVSTYESELGRYSGQDLRVTGSLMRNPGDIIVQTEILGLKSGDPLIVNWRLLKRSETFKVVDVEVKGVWLAQAQRDQITAIIGDHGGRVQAAIDVLREKLAQ